MTTTDKSTRLVLIKQIHNVLYEKGAGPMSPNQFDRLYDLDEDKLKEVLQNVKDSLRYDTN